jgi:hypothetical protein
MPCLSVYPTFLVLDNFALVGIMVILLVILGIASAGVS